MNPTNEQELREQVLTEFKQVHKLAPADYTENCTNVVMSLVEAYITANYTPINQPSTKITPVTDGVGGSESTNQSELEQKLDEVLAVFANYDESCEPGHEDVVLSRIERAKQSIKQLVAKEMNKLIMQEGVK